VIFTVPIHEYNRCHEPGGRPTGGRFCDEDGETETLYRGDGQNVGTHALAKSDVSALFGAGIYLTNNRRVAGDYTVKGATTLFRYDAGKRGTKQDAINAYIRSLATTLDANGNDLPFGGTRLHGFTYTGDSAPSAAFKAKADEDAARIKHATARWEAMKNTVEVRKSIDGLIVIRDKAARGAVSTYQIPKAWLKQTLDAEAEITEPVAAVVYDTIKAVNEGYRTQQADDVYRFATTKNEDGYYPSFRAVYRRASAMIGVMGYQFNEEAGQLALRKGLKALGYKGIRYAGGVTLGGGTKHEAYVFWDEQGLKKRRQQ